MNDYQGFLISKKTVLQPQGIEVSINDIHPKLFDFQKYITRWALHKGRAAIFLDTGLGKTFCQLEWARLLNVPVLIVAPLSVARQTVSEAKKINLNIKYIRHKNEIDPTKLIHITNYEMIDHVYDGQFQGIVLDESSILKGMDSKTKTKMLKMFKKTPYRLACTATPAPNDFMELGNHTEFLGVCKQTEMLAEWFIHANKINEKVLDNGMVVREKMSNSKGTEWRLKNFGKKHFYEWMTQWAMSMRLPSDLGFDDNRYILPPLNIYPHFVKADYKPEGMLFFDGLKGLQNRAEIRRSTIDNKIQKALELLNDEQWIIWCGLNDESSKITKLLDNAVEVKGSDSPEYKAEMIEAFQDGKYKVLVTKGKIAGYGMNLQNAHNMMFIGLSDSWEMYYQCIRREYRFGQKNPVNVHIILSDIEREIYNNVQRKEQIALTLHNELIKNVAMYEINDLTGGQNVVNLDIENETIKGNNFLAMRGDSCERLKEIENDSIDLTVYSPPFVDLYCYNDTVRDLGNSRSWNEFFIHYDFIIKELLRVTKQGRISCVHTSEIPAMAQKDGYIGVKDFPGAVIKAHEAAGWIYHGRAIVTKNPQAQAIRTHSKALLFVQLRKDSSDSRPALLDHILIFKKPGKSEIPVNPVQNGEIDNNTWIDWAGGIWTGIHESDTLQYARARDINDEKHICPLQLGTIERCIKLYSNIGDTVLTPFGGIGSEAYQALKYKRKAVLIELKQSYFDIAIKNLRDVDVDRQQLLFDL